MSARTVNELVGFYWRLKAWSDEHFTVGTVPRPVVDLVAGPRAVALLDLASRAGLIEPGEFIDAERSWTVLAFPASGVADAYAYGWVSVLEVERRAINTVDSAGGPQP